MALRIGTHYYKGLKVVVTSSTTLEELDWVFIKYPALEKVINLEYDNSTEVDNDSNSKTKPRKPSKRSSKSSVSKSEQTDD